LPQGAGDTLATTLAANGSRIATYERISLTVTLGLPAVFTWNFLRAATIHAIRGLDFWSISEFRLMFKKNPEEYRITGDFRLLNERTVVDNHRWA